MSALDRLRSAIAKMIAPASKGRSAFAGAQFNRLTSDWVMATTRSAEGDLRADLRILRKRSREQLRNSPFGARYAQLIAENVIGPTDICLQARNRTQEGLPFERANEAIETAWEDAGRAESWDVEKRLTRYESLCLAVANWGTDGEILMRIYRGPRFGRYGFAVQVLDPDLLDDQFNQEAVGNQPKIVQGVEYDEFGAPVAYHLWNRHPSDVTPDRKRARVPRADIIHEFIPQRPGQPRGIPHGAAIMATLRMLDGYYEAELVAARVESAKMGAIIDADPANPTIRDPNRTDPDVPAEAEPASLLDLRGTGATFAMWDPQHPTTGFRDFTQAMSHYVAVGLGIAYSSLTGDHSQETYSSMKVGLQPERDHWRRLTKFIIDHVLDRLYREWLAMALLNDAIPGLTDVNVERWTRVRWQARGFPSPDPLKDAQADLMLVAAGVKTLTEMCAERGEDIEEKLEERAAELQLLAELGVPSVLPNSPATPAESTPGDTPARPAAGNANQPPPRMRAIA